MAADLLAFNQELIKTAPRRSYGMERKHNYVLSKTPSWQWHRTGSCWSPVLTLPVAPLWCDLGLVPNSRGNKAVANPRPTH